MHDPSLPHKSITGTAASRLIPDALANSAPSRPFVTNVGASENAAILLPPRRVNGPGQVLRLHHLTAAPHLMRGEFFRSYKSAAVGVDVLEGRGVWEIAHWIALSGTCRLAFLAGGIELVVRDLPVAVAIRSLSEITFLFNTHDN